MQDNFFIKGKTCLVTGSNSGIGKHTALELAKMGAKIVMGCRNKKRGQEALNDIITKSGNNSVELMILDLSSLKSIRQFKKDFENKYKRLDVLINNAGVHNLSRMETIDGFEINFQINYLGPFLLTNLLLDIIKESSPSRIINVSSRYLKYGTINFDDLQSKNYIVTVRNGSLAYCQSKLALALFTFELAERLKNTHVSVNCLCPGYVRKDNSKNVNKKQSPFYIKIAKKLFIRYKNPDEGAETSIYLASSPEVEGITGKFFENKKISPKYLKYYDKDITKRLWYISEKLTEFKSEKEIK